MVKLLVKNNRFFKARAQNFVKFGKSIEIGIWDSIVLIIQIVKKTSIFTANEHKSVVGQNFMIS